MPSKWRLINFAGMINPSECRCCIPLFRITAF